MSWLRNKDSKCLKGGSVNVSTVMKPGEDSSIAHFETAMLVTVVDRTKVTHSAVSTRAYLHRCVA